MAGSELAPTLAALRATLLERVQAYDKQRALQRLADAALRGAFAGVATRGGLHLVSYVLHLLAGRKGKRRAASGQPDAGAMLADTARWGAFLGAFSGSFVLADELIAMLGGRMRTRSWRAMAAGTVAGPAMLLAGGQQAHTSLALYLAIRGLSLLIRCGNLPAAHPLKRKLLGPTRWRHGDVALMCLSSAQLAYSWIVLPQTLPSSYVRFLNKHGGKPLHVYEAWREMSSRAAAGLAPGPLAALAGTEQQHFCGGVSCGFVHPGQSCMGHAVVFFPESYLRSLPVYFPVYLVPAILVHRKRLLQLDKAPQLWRKMALGIARSSLFLSLFCTFAWLGACTGFNLAGRTTGGVLAASCWVGGLAVLAEKKSRRMELALYMFSRAVESFALCAVAWGWVRPSALPRRTDVLLFSLASGWILHCYSDHFGERRDVFRSSYLAVFDFILGNTGFSAGEISHQPSNADLLLRGVRSVRSVRSVGSLLTRGGSGFGGSSSRQHSPGVNIMPQAAGAAASADEPCAAECAAEQACLSEEGTGGGTEGGAGAGVDLRDLEP